MKNILHICKDRKHAISCAYKYYWANENVVSDKYDIIKLTVEHENKRHYFLSPENVPEKYSEMRFSELHIEKGCTVTKELHDSLLMMLIDNEVCEATK